MLWLHPQRLGSKELSAEGPLLDRLSVLLTEMIRFFLQPVLNINDQIAGVCLVKKSLPLSRIAFPEFVSVLHSQ